VTAESEYERLVDALNDASERRQQIIARVAASPYHEVANIDDRLWRDWDAADAEVAAARRALREYALRHGLPR